MFGVVPWCCYHCLGVVVHSPVVRFVLVACCHSPAVVVSVHSPAVVAFVHSAPVASVHSAAAHSAMLEKKRMTTHQSTGKQ